MNDRYSKFVARRGLTLLAGCIASALGVAVLVGWTFDIDWLKTALPGLVPMKVNTAIGMLLSGIALILVARAKRGMPVTAIAASIIAIAALTLAQYLFGWHLGLDYWIFPDLAPGANPANMRVPPSVAFCFLLFGIALLLVRRPTPGRLRDSVVLGLTTSIALIGFLGVLGHVSVLLAGMSWWNYAGMALHTSLGLVVLASGLAGLMRTGIRMSWSLDRTTTAVFCVGMVALIAITAVSHQFITRLNRDAAWASTKQEILKEIEELKSRLAALESSQRGYIITGDEKLLKSRDAEIAALQANLARTRDLTVEDEKQQKRLDELRQLIAERLEFARRTISRRQEQGFMPAADLIASGVGISLSARIGDLLESMRDSEYRVLDQRRGEANEFAMATFLILPLGAFLAMTMLNLVLSLLNFDAGALMRSTAALRESELKYRQLIEQASDGIFVLDLQGRYVLANARACELLGYREAELLGASHAITYVQADSHVPENRLDLVKTGELLRYERMVKRKDGSLFPAEFSSRMADTGVIQVIFHDITERRRAESALRESEEKFRQLIEQASDGIFLSDADGNFLLVNSIGAQMLGYAAQEMIGLNGSVTYLDEEREIHARRMREVRAGATLSFERMVKRKDGSTFPSDISIKKLENGLVQVIFRDITERKRADEALASERTLLRTLIDALPDVVFTKDMDGRFTMCNAAAYSHSGFSRESDMLGKSVYDLYEQELADQYHADDLQTLHGKSVFNREEPGVTATGMPRWFLTIKVPLREAAGKITGLIGVSRDVTERKQHEEKIARLNRIQAMLSGINSAIVRIHEPRELFREACRIATDLGRFPIALIGMLDADGQLVTVGTGGAGAALLAALPAGARGGPRGVAMRSIAARSTIVENDILQEPDVDEIRKGAVAFGCRSVISLPLFKESRPFGMFMLYGAERNAFDADEIKLLEELAGDVSFALTFIANKEKIEYLAYYDALTGLPNRTLFFDRLNWQVAAAHRERDVVVLVLLDLDRFRMVNETLGRNAGDELLKALVKRIGASVREQDIVARLAADTFAIAAVGDWRAQELAHLIEIRNRNLFSTPFFIGSEELRVSATTGVAVYPGDASNAEALVANAEAALRSAKQQNVPLLFYGPEMNAKAAESLRLESRMRRALELHQLVLWYQPKIDAGTGKLKGFEALMRWNDPEAGMISPAKFIPILEQTGLILEAGNWALLQTANDCAGWTDGTMIAPRIAVNVSPLQLRDRNFVANVVAAAERVEERGGHLDLEITESVIMENVDSIIPKLQTVRGLGVQIYIDDFGTGYSSLAYIARLPIHALKIDRSFVVGMTQNEDSLSIIKSVISLAHALKLRVVAEGVETQEQSDLLRKLECDELQGYLFSKPVAPENVPGLLSKYA
ncbi:MAG TPA: EAL domain-containing protein [Burkholderiales bacterium]|nr:EAL domain-containing protein [Burkholderiales bacterium]